MAQLIFLLFFFLLHHEIELCFKTILRKRKVTYSLVRKNFFWSPTFLIHRPSCADKLGNGAVQGLSQDLETGCPKLAIVKFWGVLFFDKGDLRDLFFNGYSETDWVHYKQFI